MGERPQRLQGVVGDLPGPNQVPQGVLGLLLKAAAAREQQVVVALPENLPTVKANADALDQILVNLVDNAIKYTPEKGAIRVSAIVEPEHVCIEVQNSGPGIPAQHLDRIFERFYRVDPGRSREVGGTGLGLSIVKHLIQQMSAEITAESAQGAGTKFRVRIPRLAHPPDQASS